MGGRAGEKRWECAPKERIFMSGAAAARWGRAGFWRERRDGDGGRYALPWAGRALCGGGDVGIRGHVRLAAANRVRLGLSLGR